MNKTVEGIKLLVATVGGFAGYFLGGIDSLLKGLIILVVLDYLSGLIKGFYTKRISSNIGLKGIAKKVYLFIIIAVAFIIERSVGFEFPLREIVIMFFIANEGLSILENAVEIGIPIPTVLKKSLIQIRNKEEETEE